MSPVPAKSKRVPDITQAPPLDIDPDINEQFDWDAFLDEDEDNHLALTTTITPNDEHSEISEEPIQHNETKASATRKRRERRRSANRNKHEEKGIEQETTPNRPKNAKFHCPTCDIYVSCRKTLNSHLRGKKHTTNARQKKLESDNNKISTHSRQVVEIPQVNHQKHQTTNHSTVTLPATHSKTNPSQNLKLKPSQHTQPQTTVPSNTFTVPSTNIQQPVKVQSHSLNRSFSPKEDVVKPSHFTGLRSEAGPSTMKNVKRKREFDHSHTYHHSYDEEITPSRSEKPSQRPIPKQYFERDPSVPTLGFGMKADHNLMREDAPLVPKQWLNEPMVLKEWAELRETAFKYGDDIDKLAFKIMKETLLSPTCGIGFDWLQPISKALMEFGGEQHFNPYTGGFYRADRVPEVLREPQNSEEKEENYKRGSEEEKKIALRKLADNLAYLFFPEDDMLPIHNPADAPMRGGIGLRTIAHNPEQYTGHSLRSKFHDCVLEDKLFAFLSEQIRRERYGH